MNLSNALALNAKKTTVVKTTKTTPDFQLSVEEKSTIITFSDSFMKKADVQNNNLNVYYENADECVYFIFHQGNGNPEESLAIDFFKGKRKSIINEDGTKTLLDEIGIKTSRFKDAKTVSGETLKELITLQYPITRTVSQLKGEFEKHEEDFNMDLKVTSVWKFKSITHPSFNTPVSNGVPSSFTTINNEVKQTPLYDVVTANNSTETAINNFETVGQSAKNQVSLFDENGELNQ